MCACVAGRRGGSCHHAAARARAAWVVCCRSARVPETGAITQSMTST
jgi:hypothetical protein